MSKPIDLVVGSIISVDNDRLAMQTAYFRKDAECEELKKKIRNLIKKYSKKRK